MIDIYNISSSDTLTLYNNFICDVNETNFYKLQVLRKKSCCTKVPHLFVYLVIRCHLFS